jgi:hypothetical protein
VVGASVYDAKPAQVCTVQASAHRKNSERPEVERAALNILKYAVTSISKTCRVFYFAAAPASVGFYLLRTMSNTRHSMNYQIAARTTPGNFG